MSKQLVVIANNESLIDQLGPSYSCRLLDAESDGVSQVTNYVATHPGFDATNLTSHGAPGSISVET